MYNIYIYRHFVKIYMILPYNAKITFCICIAIVFYVFDYIKNQGIIARTILWCYFWHFNDRTIKLITLYDNYLFINEQIFLVFDFDFDLNFVGDLSDVLIRGCEIYSYLFWLVIIKNERKKKYWNAETFNTIYFPQTVNL